MAFEVPTPPRPPSTRGGGFIRTLPLVLRGSGRGWGYSSLLVATVTLFAIGTSVLSWSNARAVDLAPRFHWPDETTNYFFASRVARGESLSVPEPRNLDAGNIIHPRTMNVRADGALVPGSYLGLPLWYGVVGRVFGERAMLFVTPIFAALGLLAFASIVRRLIGLSAALIATVLLVLHPSVWLFTATAFLPNVPFVALVLMGVAVLVRADSRQPTAASPHPPAPPLPEGAGETKKNFSPSHREGEREGVGRRRVLSVRWLLGGLLLGLALTIRTHELVWAVTLAVAIVWHHHMSLRGARSDGDRTERRGNLIVGRLLVFCIGLALPFIPILVLNSQLYGSPFTTGYALLQDGGAAPTEFVSSMLPSWLTALVAPFGWHPVDAFSRFWQYMVVPYPWSIAFSVAGLITYALSHFRTKMRKVFGDQSGVAIGTTLSPPTPPPHIVGRGGTGGRGGIGTIVLTIWLVLYYGSWTIADPLVRETNVLTISYVRYWLPIVVVLVPWAAVGLLAIAGRMPTRWRAHAIALVFLGIALTSFSQVVTDPTEGLLRQRQALDEHRVRARAVIAATEPNAVIVSHRMDKVFFPERAVVHVPTEMFSPLLPEGEREGVVSNLRTLVDRMPVYWYAPGEIAMPGFTFESVGAMPLGERLYRVE